MSRPSFFDTGNDEGIFARNVEQLGVDLPKLIFTLALSGCAT